MSDPRSWRTQPKGYFLDLIPVVSTRSDGAEPLPQVRWERAVARAGPRQTPSLEYPGSARWSPRRTMNRSYTLTRRKRNGWGQTH
jgi:hypothetical protein